MLVFVLTLSLLDVVYAQEYSLLWKYETGDWVRSVAISSDGKYIVAGSSDKNVYLFNREGELLWKYKTGDTVWSWEFLP